MIDDSQLVATLLEEGLADQATVDLGLEETAESGKSLYEVLLAAQLVDEPDLVGVMSRLLDIPSRKIEPKDISTEVRSLVPASMARRNRVLPLERSDDGELYLAMADPRDSLALDEIATHTGATIRPILVGPAALSAALRSLYPSNVGDSDVADAVMEAFDNFEVGDYMDDVMPGEEWSDLFEEGSQGEVEDSTVLSRDMQDRPSTDVLAEEDVDAAIESADEDDLPEIEIIEELGQPIRRRPPSPYASLDSWDVDDAIAGESEIVAAHSANGLFGSAPEAAEALIEEEVDETSNLQIADEISESHTDALETQSSRTSVGVGVDHLKQADSSAGEVRAKKKKRATIENTGKTQLGLPNEVSSADEVEDDDDTSAKKPKEVASAKPLRRTDPKNESTDYGALGRAILKSGPTTKDDAPADASEADDEPTAEPDDQTNITEGAKTGAEDHRPTDPQGLDGSAPSSPDDDDDDDDDDEVGERKSNTSIVVALFEDDDDVPVDVQPRAPTHARSSQAVPAVTKAQAASAKAEPEPEPEIAEEPTPAPPVVEPPVPDAGDAEVAVAQAAAAEPVDLPNVEPDAGTRPRLSTPALTLPEEIDPSGLALALANLLVSKGILTTDEIFALARRLSSNKK